MNYAEDIFRRELVKRIKETAEVFGEQILAGIKEDGGGYSQYREMVGHVKAFQMVLRMIDEVSEEQQMGDLES